MSEKGICAVLDELASIVDMTSGENAWLVHRFALTKQRIEDLTVGELVNTIRSTRRDYADVYGEVA